MNNIPQTNENEKQIMHSVCVKYKFGRMTVDDRGRFCVTFVIICIIEPKYKHYITNDSYIYYYLEEDKKLD
ncbi:hypothetical protein [Petroclostridium xylanilyticum]|jgi:hypothetical protein|uniref:hypothetical protein n=1 Tax=Petroclostridium xylanilyticum TaxID=1792311 RepID=UPI000B99C3BE|nr:hypothetical protein [Petroclostridium xylanilyticum]